MKRPFKGLALRDGPASSYDAVIIGAGIGGLICANLLAQNGLSVLLVEQHYMVGGYCSTFRRKGFTFDAATHFYPLLGNPNTISGRLLSDLGITTGWVKMDPVDHFHFPDGSRFSVPADFDLYLAKLKDEFPNEAHSLDGFFAAAREAYLLGLLRYFRSRQTGRATELENLTVRQVLDRWFQDPKLKLLLTADCPHWGSPPCRTSFLFDSMLRLSYFLGNYYPRGGSQAFADELGQRFEEMGGHILTSSAVKQILVKNGSACGIEVETGPMRARFTRKAHAEVVVSNADYLLTLEQLLGPGSVRPEYLHSVRRLRPTYPCYLVHIGLKDISSEILRDAQGYYWDSWDADRVGKDALNFKIFVPTLFEPQMAPEGCHTVIIQKVIDIDYGAISDWSSHKSAVERLILSNVERLIPGFSHKIVTMSSASALTSYRFTLNQRGAMLGWEMSPDQLGEGRPSVEGPVRNLYFVGHWTRPGGGITPVIVSAMQVAKTITKRSMEAGTSLAVLASRSGSTPNATVRAFGSELA
jgi:phytoene dehydrogenase-like protein